MSVDWKVMVRGSMPSSAEFLGETFDDIFNDLNGIDDIDAEACALAAAASTSNGGLAHEIGMQGILFKTEEREAAKTAAAHCALTDVYSTYRIAPAGFHDPVHTVSSEKFAMYCFAASVANRNSKQAKVWEDILSDTHKMSNEQIQTIAKIASIIAAFNRIVI